MSNKPLNGYLVLDFGQFLSAPSAGLRLADLGAKVIKIENKQGGDICRHLYISDVSIDDDSTLFHAINRNKYGMALNLKDPKDQETIRKYIAKADIMLVNFRPNVSKRLSLDFETVKQINPGIIYGEITGYGSLGPWVEQPGQDLLVQALSGVCYLNGNKNQPPMPLGLSIADLLAGEHLVQGVLAGLFHRLSTGKAVLIEVDMMSSILDFQFESFTTYLNSQRLPERNAFNNANPYLKAPYGIYSTKNGYLAIAMCPLSHLAELLNHTELKEYLLRESDLQDDYLIKNMIQKLLLTENTEYWLNILEPADVWCTKVYEWNEFTHTSEFEELQMVQKVSTSNATLFETLRCPIRINGEILTSAKGAPLLGEDNNIVI